MTGTSKVQGVRRSTGELLNAQGQGRCREELRSQIPCRARRQKKELTASVAMKRRGVREHLAEVSGRTARRVRLKTPTS